MWECVGCGERNEDQFDVCWKCQQPVGEVDPNETQLDILFDPEKPQPVLEGDKVQCPTCGQQFAVKRETTVVRKSAENALCPHCGHTVTPEVVLKVAPERREGSAPRVREVIYACPYCGKVLSVQQQ